MPRLLPLPFLPHKPSTFDPNRYFESIYIYIYAYLLFFNERFIIRINSNITTRRIHKFGVHFHLERTTSAANSQLQDNFLFQIEGQYSICWNDRYEWILVRESLVKISKNNSRRRIVLLIAIAELLISHFRPFPDRASRIE